MKKTILLLAAFVIFGTASVAHADSSVTTTSSSTQTSSYYVSNDPAVVASLAALNAATTRYDLYVMSILNHSQLTDYAAMEKHFDWFTEHPMTSDNLNGYLAYMEQRLKLDAAQESQLTAIESRFLSEVGPLYTAYQQSLTAAYEAWRLSRVSTVVHTQGVVQEVEVQQTVRSTTTTVEPKAEVKAETPRVQRTFIRNKDMK